MTAITFDFQIVNSSGDGVEGIAFPGTGAVASPGLVSLVSHDAAKTTLTPSWVTFVEWGKGYYGLIYDADVHGEAFAIIDAGGAVSGASRYPGVPLTADSSRVQTAIDETGAVQALDSGAFTTVGPAPTPVADDATWRDTFLGQVGALVARNFNKVAVDRTAKTLAVYDDTSSDVVLSHALDDTGAVQTQEKAG